MENKELYKEVLNKTGFAFQFDIAMEEMSELTKALFKIKRIGTREFFNPKGELTLEVNHFTSKENALAYHDVCSEIADVEIMIEQLKEIFNKESIQLTKERKLERLKKRMNL